MIENWGVRARVTLVAVLPTLVLALLLTGFYATVRLADLEESHLNRGSAFARQLMAASEYAVFSGNRDALQQLTNALLEEEGVLGVSVFDRFGDTLAKSGTLDDTDALKPTPDLSTALRHGDVLRISEPIQPGRIDIGDDLMAVSLDAEASGNPISLGHIVLDLSLARLQAQRAELLATGAATVAAVLLAALMLAFRMSRSVSGPIRQVARTVSRIGQGRFEERVPILGGGSLRTLAEGVNEMAGELSAMHQQMSKRIADATAELRARKEEAEYANMAKSRFLAAASHDLRQPMHALGLFIAELGQHRLEPQAHQLLDQIAASAGAMEALMDGLLDISKLDAGVLKPSIRSFSLRPLLERIAGLQQRIALEHGVTLRFRMIDCRVLSDPVLIERIVVNLVSNAIHHGDRGRVLVACRRRRDSVIIEVRDNGPGIAPEAQGIVFQEFVQLHNPGRARDKGLGLGLAIVRRLSDLLQLRLTLCSTPGHGATFAITLPLAHGGSATETQLPEDRQPADLHGVRVALIEDDPLALAAMESLLGSWGCRLHLGTNLDDLLAALPPDEAPQVIVSDYRLGEDSGVDVVAALRSRFGAELPAALVSGDTAPEVLAHCQQAGLPLLHKPVRPARLRAFLSRSINRCSS
jgi:signal transduction histidine kinase